MIIPEQLKEMTINHCMMVKAFNNKIGKTEYKKDIEYCLYREEFAELCEGYRKKDRYKIVDTLVDLYYYKMFYYSSCTGLIEDEFSFENYVKSLSKNGGFVQGYAETLIDKIELLNDDSEYDELTFFISLGYTLQDFIEYFDIVHEENMNKFEVKDGKVQKGENRKEQTETKKAIVDRVHFDI